MPSFKQISWTDLGRLLPDRATNYKSIVSKPQRLMFLGILTQTRGAQATAQLTNTFCFIRKETVEVDWSGFDEVVKAASAGKL